MTKMLNTKAFELWLAEQASNIVRFRQIEKGEVLAEYISLKTIVEASAFQAKKKELLTTCYANTNECKTMTQYNQLRWKMAVLLYNLLKKEAWKEKEEVAQYLQLQEQIQTPEFQQANAFWKNKKRWFTTPESKQEQRYNELAKHADIIFFHQHSEQEIASLESYKMVWAEEFDGTKMSDTWQTGFLYPSKEFKADHSHVAEMQAYTKGKNTTVANSVLIIQTKKEKTTAPAWHPTKGMLIHPFTHTSDVWHTAKAVTPKTGVLQAKVNCSGKAKQVLCLTKANVQKGLSVLPAQLAKGYAVYTLVWNEKEAITYINNVEVARTANPLSGESLHLLLRSYLPENQKATGKLTIDWIRIYTK